jgi:hypothetical protein
LNFLRRLVSKKKCKGQATTEMVLLFPLFMFFAFGLVKIFMLLVLVQKIEIAAVYAARRYQLESHRNALYAWPGWDKGSLAVSILKVVRDDYLGCSSGKAAFLGVECGHVQLTVEPTQVWNVVRLTVPVRPFTIPVIMTRGHQMKPFVVTKYVPSRDRPIGLSLPGI